MKPTTLSSLVLCSLVLGACGAGEVSLTAETEVIDPETGQPVVRAIEDMPVQLLPFDRDAIFDSLAAAAPSPEPQMPPELQVARDSIVQAQEEWRESENRWLALRERMVEINDELQQFNPAEPQYRVLFQEFDAAEQAALQAERVKDEAFARFDRLQQETFSEMESFRAQLTAWEEEAFAPFGEVIQARVDATGREILADTTDATGRAMFEVDPADWWIYARYPVATEELYWNVPVTVERGTPVELILNRSNAEVREIL